MEEPGAPVSSLDLSFFIKARFYCKNSLDLQNLLTCFRAFSRRLWPSCFSHASISPTYLSNFDKNYGVSII